MSNFLYAIAKAQSEAFQSMANQQAVDAQTTMITVQMVLNIMATERTDLQSILDKMNEIQYEMSHGGDQKVLAQEMAYWQARFNESQTQSSNAVSQMQSAVSQNQGIVSTDSTNLQQQLQLMLAVNSVMQMLGNLLSANY
jgi:hypothetical protein